MFTRFWKPRHLNLPSSKHSSNSSEHRQESITTQLMNQYGYVCFSRSSWNKNLYDLMYKKVPFWRQFRKIQCLISSRYNWQVSRQDVIKMHHCSKYMMVIIGRIELELVNEWVANRLIHVYDIIFTSFKILMNIPFEIVDKKFKNSRLPNY